MWVNQFSGVIQVAVSLCWREIQLVSSYVLTALKSRELQWPNYHWLYSVNDVLKINALVVDPSRHVLSAVTKMSEYVHGEKDSICLNSPRVAGYAPTHAP